MTAVFLSTHEGDLTIDDLTEWYCAPHDTQPITVINMVAPDIVIAVLVPIDLPPLNLFHVLSKMSAAAWSFVQGRGVIRGAS